MTQRSLWQNMMQTLDPTSKRWIYLCSDMQVLRCPSSSPRFCLDRNPQASPERSKTISQLLRALVSSFAQDDVTLHKWAVFDQMYLTVPIFDAVKTLICHFNHIFYKLNERKLMILSTSYSF